MGSITEETVSRAAGGDHAAFNEIYHAYESGLRSYITLHLSDKSQAEDVLQNTFVAVFKNIGQLKNPAGIKSWLYKIAYNECMTVNGAVKRDSERYAPMSSFADEDGNEREFADDRLELPEDFATNAELQRLLTKTLNSLPKAQRDCLVLYYYRQKPVAEIAEMLGVTENAVKLRKKNALDKLRRKLEKYRGSYNFALAPMGLFVGKLVGTGKVKSAYAGAALVRSATASVAAACVAGAVGITAVGYFGLNRDDDKNKDKDDSSIIETDEDGWTEIDLAAKVPEVFQTGDFIEPSTQLVLIPDGTYVGYPENYEPYKVPDDIPQEYLDNYGMTEAQCHKLFDDKYKIPELLPADSGEYRFLKLEKMQYKDDSVRLTFVPYLSELENFTSYDPGFADGTPVMTVNCGLSTEYTVSGDMEIKDGSVIMTFDGIEEPAGFGKKIPADKDMINKKVYSLTSEMMVEADLENDNNMVYGGIFDISLDNYYMSISDAAGIYLPFFYEFSYGVNIPVPLGLSFAYPGTAFSAYVSRGCNFYVPAFVLGEDGSINIVNDLVYEQRTSLSDDYCRPLIKKINLTDNAVNCGYFIKDDILYQHNYAANNTLVQWFPSDRHYDSIELPESFRDFQNINVMEAFDADRIVLGNDCQEFYDYLIALAASNITSDSSENGFAGREVAAGKRILARLENYEQYSASGDIETDIANALPYYDENGNWIDYNEELEVADETEFDDVEEYEAHFFDNY